MKWIRIEGGEYYSEDERFHILKSYDLLHGNGWTVYDRKTKQDWFKDSLKDCKHLAETFLINM